MDIHPTLLNEIDAVELGASNRAWREAVRTAGWRIHGDRQRLAAESWRATEGEDPDHTLQGIGDRGIIDAADALYAVKHLVFDEKKLTMAELMDALDSDFAGERGEEIRQMCLAAPKFGNDLAGPDEHSDLIVRIGGFSAYFVQLSNEIQDDVIYRSELSL